MEDLGYCLDDSVQAFVGDVKLIQFCIDRQSARLLQPTTDTNAPTVRVSQSFVAEREEIKNMGHDDLQAFLAQKLLGNKSKA